MHEQDQNHRVEFTRAIISLLDQWGVPAKDQLSILALPPGTRPGVIRQYRQNTPLPDDAQVAERIEHLIGIAEALRTSYPLNAAMDAVWMNSINRRFDDRTPLAVMVEDGLSGVIAVRAHLDCAFDWGRMSSI